VRSHRAWLLPAVCLTACLAAACRTLPSDRVVQSPGEEQAAAFEAYALRLLDLRLAPDAARLAALRAELDAEAARPGSSRLAQARLESLRAEAALLAGDLAAAKKLAEAAARLSDAVEGSWLVRAALEPAPAKRLAILEEGIVRANPKLRLLCERGRALLKAGRYAEAAQDLDEGLRGLDPRYRALYGADRDHALSLAQAAREAGTTVTVERPETLDAALTVRGLVERAFSQTHLLASLSSDPNPTYAAVLPALKTAGLLLEPSAAPESPALRKAVAFFLWGLVARTERDPKLLTRYRLKYSFSPVPDVAADAPWFDAVLGVVEREIMDLPDGTSFLPEEPVTGLEYLSILQRLQKPYR
jgi:tetratricopeptide (TPR) repeat protein